jgi:hypothetical protein
MVGDRLKWRLGLLAVTAIAAAATPAAASANTITIDSTADPGAPGICTLRDAIAAANSNSAQNGCTAGGGASDVIDATGISGTITLAASLPTLTTNLDINGPGSGSLAVNGQDLYRPINDTGPATTVSISGLTITHALGFGGAGILNSTGTLTLTDVVVSQSHAISNSPSNQFAQGGGIDNNGGTLHLILSTVANNAAVANGGTNQNAPSGGGIWTNGTLTLDRSTVSGNQATADAATGNSSSASGGGISLQGGSLTATQSTISGNTASATGGATSNDAHGGGIAVATAAGVSLVLDRVTVAGNTATASGTSPSASVGGIRAAGTTGSVLDIKSSTIATNSAPLYANLEFGGATQTVKNTIVSDPLGGGQNCSPGGAASQGYNIDSGTSCGFNQTGDQTNTGDPQLGPLLNKGGPTETMLPGPNSPALDKGQSSGETVDQRGLQRPWLFDVTEPTGGDGTDIGAVEVQGPVPTGTTPASPGASGTPNVFGTVDSGSLVQLFTGAACNTQVASGSVAAFRTPGLVPSTPVPEGTTTTFSVRSTYGSATSICSPTTIDYTRTATPPPSGGGATPPSTTPPTKKKCKKKKRATAAKKKCKKKKK